MKNRSAQMIKNIITGLDLISTKYCVLTGVSHRSITCLSLSASENNWSFHHSYTVPPYFAQPCPTVLLNNNFINHQNGKSNSLGNCIQAEFCALEWVFCNLYSTTCYKNTKSFDDTLMMISKVNRFQAKIFWIFLLGKISTRF